MTRGQETLDIGLVAAQVAVELGLAEALPQAARIVLRASGDERAAHAAMCERIERESRGRCLWMHLATSAS
jgi:DNA polymerase-3 subunit epsilon